MKRSRRFLSILCGLYMILALTAPALAADVESEGYVAGGVSLDKIAECVNDTSVLINPELGLIFVSTKDSDTQLVETELSTVDFGSAETRSDPEKQTSATFTHKVYDRNNILMATIKSTVAGTYSFADRTSQITDISASISGDFAHDFSTSSSLNGNQGTLYVYFNGLGAGSFTYKITTNGVISNI